MSKVIRMTESDLNRIIKESVNAILVNQMIKEDYSVEQETHFAVNKKTNLIVNGWDYSGYDGKELRNDKRYYFYDDLDEMGFNHKEYDILKRETCLRLGIDPNDYSNWSNDGLTSISDAKNSGMEV